jgi:hypothetical protein
MPKSTKGPSAPKYPSFNGLIPIHQSHSSYFGSALYEFEESETAIRESGFLPQGTCFPETRYTGVIIKDRRIRLSRLADGRIRLKITAELIAAADKEFRQFLDGILADSRLSLVKGESA